MQVIEQASAIRSIVQALRCSGKSIGFVPTMGALHNGHLQLIRAAAQQNDITICSVFVNPTQFNNQEDYKLYPRSLEQDTAALAAVGCDYLFAPTAADMYPEQSLLHFSFGVLEEVMEGAHRPGHFNGVAIIVSKLFHLVQPHRAYFGQKDLQQVAVVRQLVQGLGFDLEVVCYPTIREASGLAMSSRNKRLDVQQLEHATHLHKALLRAEAQIGAKPVAAIKEDIVAYLAKVPQLQLEYFEIANPATLQPVPDLSAEPEVALCIAAHVGPVRLIDNMIVKVLQQA
ncbi:pantoate--beta-alanine ligase [Pontibacter qinzhouensis]|uniref:Pantothenate synthetase n=1 Tax=Pontibacter qinzhouensis TaxID=2603253 RepID=A0A5C8JIL7_9BACT|nr:pantoate--beta-alanine ligase [Pontibacter qinzhouensis]TXK36397.1 pantoate--beta-alanine ligase [Pontibacter qinzhouensis]